MPDRLTTTHFDEITKGPEKLWGLQAIADAIGVSRDKVRRLARLDNVPIYCPIGQRETRRESAVGQNA